MKGLFIPEITVEMFRNGCLESIEALMAEGEIYDIEYEPEQRWIPVTERLPEKGGHYLVQTEDSITIMEYCFGNPNYHENPAFVSDVLGRCNGYVVAWMPLPAPYKEVR